MRAPTVSLSKKIESVKCVDVIGAGQLGAVDLVAGHRIRLVDESPLPLVRRALRFAVVGPVGFCANAQGSSKRSGKSTGLAVAAQIAAGSL
jgi:hypothetical protein